jgi:hypothetical protein
MSKHSDRRRFLQRSGSLVTGAALAGRLGGAPSFAQQQVEKPVADAAESPFLTYQTLSDLKGKIPVGRIGEMPLSRVFLGGNQMGGWVSGRDLKYVRNLALAYSTKQKIFETLRLAENCGVNTLLTNPKLCTIINEYWDQGGTIQFISDCGGGDILKGIKTSIDHGATAGYLHGSFSDRTVAKGDFDLMRRALDLLKSHGIPAGIGGHRLDTIRGCVDHGLKPDFWMKTLHRSDYPSYAVYHPCDDPDATIAYMQELEQPWIAFKVLAQGAIHPKVAFPWCFKNGADFLCVGMYDFELVENVNLACDVLAGDVARSRPWRG